MSRYARQAAAQPRHR